ncbi:MAG: hypothetical protein PHO26_03810 [Dehalococcoidia bacterium]|nr:hypothetical protein [Dehalococcoidia bacterium]MDD5493610.1 hypothetical protein [Dehalococcoidia bacterium]
MRIKVLAAVTLLTIILSLVPSGDVQAVVGMSPTQGMVGLEVTISGLTDGASYKIKWDGVAIKQGIAGTTGAVYLIVPESYGGEHSVIVESPPDTQIFSGTFAVVPNITIDPTSGVVGTAVTVVGRGFGVSEKNVAVTYEGTVVKSDLSANENGSWNTSFFVEPSSGGNHAVDASGDITKASDVANKNFAVSPSVKMDPVAGGVGTLVTITATGFASAESGIKITYSGKEVRSGLIAEVNGSWSTSFAVPSSTRGTHVVNALGNTTAATDIGDMVFTVAPAVNISPNTGYVEDTIKINGSGYANNETGIEVTLDGKVIERSVIADDSGFWSTTLKIPACANGPHTITAVGKITPASEITPSIFTTQSQVISVPKSGNVKDLIRITGSGFSSYKDFSISFDTISVATGTTTESGDFTSSFPAPGGKSGAVTITATDMKNVTASTTFNMEATAPEVPVIASPKDGAVVGIMGDTRVTFDWSDVSDPSGISYSIEVSDQSNFINKLVNRSKLTDSKYTLTEAESLPQGEYYWHVRATDGAGNSSDWTSTSVVKVGLVTPNMLLYVAIGLVVLLVALMVFKRATKKKRPKRDWE